MIHNKRTKGMRMNDLLGGGLLGVRRWHVVVAALSNDRVTESESSRTTAKIPILILKLNIFTILRRPNYWGGVITECITHWHEEQKDGRMRVRNPLTP